MSPRLVYDSAHQPIRRVEQLDALTSLRFFAAFHVLLFHSSGYIPGSLPQIGALQLGYTGVTFFFVLSGFILAHNYSTADFGAGETLWRYVAARLARIYPVLLLSLAISLPFLVLEVGFPPEGTLHALKASSLVLAPLGLHAWVPGAAAGLNLPSWSVSTEIFFYLVFPFIVSPIMRAPWRWSAAILSLWLASILGQTWLWRLVGEGGSILAYHDDIHAELAAELIKFFPIGRLWEFAAGIALYAGWSRAGSSKGNQGTAALVAALLAGCIILAVHEHLSEIALHNGLTIVVWAPLIVWAAGLRNGWLTHPWMLFLGRISFSIYLLHVPIILYARGIAAGLGLWDRPVAVLLVTTAASLLAAGYVFVRVEEPCRRGIQDWCMRLRGRPVRA